MKQSNTILLLLVVASNFLAHAGPGPGSPAGVPAPAFTNAGSIWVNANGATGVYGLPEAPFPDLASAISAAGLDDKLYLSGNIALTDTVTIANCTIVGGGAIISSSYAIDGPVGSLALSNCTLQDLVLTNSMDTYLSPVLSVAKTGGPFYGRNLRVYGRGYAALFHTDPPDGCGQPDFRDCLFSAEYCAMETWHTKGLFSGCTFEAAGPYALGDFTQGLVCNDASTNTFIGCVITARNAGEQNVGVTLFDHARSEFTGCTFRLGRSATSVQDTAVWIAEPNTKTFFNHCFFDIAYRGSPPGLLCIMDEMPAGGDKPSYVEFNDCWFTPATNGVIIDNNTHAITVRGGNLKPIHFSNPANVSWVDSVVATNLVGARLLSTDAGNPLVANLAGGMNVAAAATFTNGTTRPFGSLILTHHTIGFTATNQPWGGDGGERAQTIPKSSGLASDFRAITNFDSGLGFRFATDPVKGALTNQLAGVYRVSVSASFYTKPSDVYRLAVCTNGVVVPHLVFTSPGPALNGKVLDVTLNGSGLLTLGPNTAIDVRMICYAQDETVRWFNVNVVVDEP
jgi:hypothetical protein